MVQNTMLQESCLSLWVSEIMIEVKLIKLINNK
jgi:hypothetical protein